MIYETTGTGGPQTAALPNSYLLFPTLRHFSLLFPKLLPSPPFLTELGHITVAERSKQDAPLFSFFLLLFFPLPTAIGHLRRLRHLPRLLLAPIDIDTILQDGGCRGEKTSLGVDDAAKQETQKQTDTARQLALLLTAEVRGGQRYREKEGERKK